ncbi:hypothetical protein PR048_019453 [Dryococelus australis]|uniref:Uncharacterized protein n=1 Tax=Dryococelus australis TaxID=614101 RepID=A0ABQ9H3I8_9NEOP|nr:hypothetical protein PR048_019453 [Dryococelus australis]
MRPAIVCASVTNLKLAALSRREIVQLERRTHKHGGRSFCAGSFVNLPSDVGKADSGSSSPGIGARGTSCSVIPIARRPYWKPGSIPGGAVLEFSHVGIVPDDVGGRWVFLGTSHLPSPFHSGAAPSSPRFTLIGSQDLDVKSRSDIFTHFNHSLLEVSGPCFVDTNDSYVASEGGKQEALTTAPYCCQKIPWQIRHLRSALAAQGLLLLRQVFMVIEAVHNKVSNFVINLRKMSLSLPVYILTGALSEMCPSDYSLPSRRTGLGNRRSSLGLSHEGKRGGSCVLVSGLSIGTSDPPPPPPPAARLPVAIHGCSISTSFHLLKRRHKPTSCPPLRLPPSTKQRNNEELPCFVFKMPLRSGNITSAGGCRWSVGFLGDLPFPPPVHSGLAPYSPHFTLIGSEDLDFKSRPNLFTHSVVSYTLRKRLSEFHLRPSAQNKVFVMETSTNECKVVAFVPLSKLCTHSSDLSDVSRHPVVPYTRAMTLLQAVITILPPPPPSIKQPNPRANNNPPAQYCTAVNARVPIYHSSSPRRGRRWKGVNWNNFSVSRSGVVRRTGRRGAAPKHTEKSGKRSQSGFNIEVLRVYEGEVRREWRSAGMQGRGKWEYPDKTRRTVSSSGPVPLCGNPGTIPLEIKCYINFTYGQSGKSLEGPGFDSRSETTPVKCWDGSLTNAMADSFPEVGLPREAPAGLVNVFKIVIINAAPLFCREEGGRVEKPPHKVASRRVAGCSRQKAGNLRPRCEELLQTISGCELVFPSSHQRDTSSTNNQECRGRGGVVVRLLATYHLGEPSSLHRRCYFRIFACGNRSPGRCHSYAGFLGDRGFPRGSLVSPRLFIPALLHTHIPSPSQARC